MQPTAGSFGAGDTGSSAVPRVAVPGAAVPAASPAAGLAVRLRQAADIVASLADCSADVDALSDADVIAGQGFVTDIRRLSDTYGALFAASLARRSHRELGDAGLAAKEGFTSPELFIQQITGTTRRDADKLIAIGTFLAETDAADKLVETALTAAELETAEALLPWQAPLTRAIRDGLLSVDAADSICRGLGNVDQCITAEKLHDTLAGLIDDARHLNVTQLFRRARHLRDQLDAAGITAREKQAVDDTVFKVWRCDDGTVKIFAALAPEDGEWWMSTYEALTSPRTSKSGVRFMTKKQAQWAKHVQEDPRSTDLIAATAFTQLLRHGSDVDPGQIMGGSRPTVRVIVTENVLDTGAGYGHLEGNPAPVSLETIERHLCDTGATGVKFDDDGQCVNVGRDQRLFNNRQRTGLAVRDGGCRWENCDRPPSWCEAHHIEHWQRDQGKTDIADGILLCRRHHMLLHNNHWQIIRDRGHYWSRPPASLDPQQKLRLLPSKSPYFSAGWFDDTATD
jgi:hypothetical protein